MDEGPEWRAGHFLGGWGVSRVTTLQSGVPFDVTEPDDRCLCNSGNQRPDFLGATIQIFDPRSTSAVAGRANSWFDGTGGGTGTAAANPFFRRVGSNATFAGGAGRFGNFGRNVLHGPGINNWDFGIFKNTRIREAHQLEFRAEFFNLFNHAQFTILPTDETGNVGSPNFGKITSTREPFARVIQFGLRYRF